MSGTGLKNSFTYLGTNVGLEIEQFQNQRIESGETRASRNTNASLSFIFLPSNSALDLNT